MKRSEINALIRDAQDCFTAHGWTLPPRPRWDVTDFGLGDLAAHGLVLVNLAEEPEYCEKLMYARAGMVTPPHRHVRKKEDIICRWGTLQVTVWPGVPDDRESVEVKVDGIVRALAPGSKLEINAGSRITLFPGVLHQFVPLSPECIIGEVSTANDDVTDNLFSDPRVGRFPQIEEDAPLLVRLVSD